VSANVRVGVDAELNYLAPDSHLNRRYVAPGAELNTGRYEPHRVHIRNARLLRPAPTLDREGFVLNRHTSAVRDFHDAAAVERDYPAEACALVRALTGADHVVPLGWVLRSAGQVAPGRQPPATDVHVDMTADRACRLAASLLAQQGTAPAGRRFLASSLWRALSEPPQDWPLTLCDARSVAPTEGVPNLMVRVERMPGPEALTAPLADEESLPAAYVFHYSPQHRWYFFPDMTREEVVLLKLHDSDHSRAWRVPHSAFRDPAVRRATPRESIEFRSVAYFR